MRKAQTAAPRPVSADIVRELSVRFSPHLSAVIQDICFVLENHGFVLGTGLVLAGVGRVHFWRNYGLVGRSSCVLYANPVRPCIYQQIPQA